MCGFRGEVQGRLVGGFKGRFKDRMRSFSRRDRSQLPGANRSFAFQRFHDLVFKSLHEPLPAPRLHADLEHEKKQHVNGHQAPSTPCAHAADLVAPNLLLVVSGQNAGAKFGRRFFRLSLRHRQALLSRGLGLLIGMIGSVEGCETLQVIGGPGMLTLQ